MSNSRFSNFSVVHLNACRANLSAGLLTGKLAKSTATVDSLAEQSCDLLAAKLEDHHFEEHDGDPGEYAAVVGDDREVVKACADVGQQSDREDEHDRQDHFVVHEVQASR